MPRVFTRCMHPVVESGSEEGRECVGESGSKLSWPSSVCLNPSDADRNPKAAREGLAALDHDEVAFHCDSLGEEAGL